MIVDFEVANSAIKMPDTPGWGIEPDEAAIHARPPRKIMIELSGSSS